MTEKKVTVTTEFRKPHGAEEYARVGRKAQEAMAPGKDSVKKFDELEKSLAKIAKAATMMSKVFNDREAVRGLKEMNAEAEKLKKNLEAVARKHTITGAVTGGAVGAYLGGGMGGAGAGATIGGYLGGKAGGVAGGVIGGVGTRAWGVGRAFASTAFTGLQGMQTGMAGLPVVGSTMSGLMGAGMAAAQGALGVQAARHGMNPYLSAGYMPAGTQMADAARARAEASVYVPEELAHGSISRPRSSKIRRLPGETKEQYIQRRLGRGAPGMAAAADAGTFIANAAGAGAANEEQKKAREDALRRRRNAGRAAHDAVMFNSDPFSFLRQTGVKYGMNETASLAAAGSYFGARGGAGSMDRFLVSQQGRAQYQQALEAQGRYGVGMEASGGLARGALNGAGAVNLEKTIKDGMKLGIDASESVSSMAARIRAFEETGIPVASESLTALRAGLAQTMGGMRGAAVASQMMGAMQGVGRHGPQSSADWAMMTTMGGYQGGGIREWMQARQRMEEGGGGAAGLQKFIGKIANSGDEWANIMRVQDVFASKGISVSQSDARGMIGGDRESLARWAPILADQATQAAGVNLNGTAGQAGAGGQRQSSLENARNASGEKLLRTAQNLEEVSQKMLDNFSELAPAMTLFTSWAKDQPAKMKEYFTKVDGLLNMAHDIMVRK